MYKEFCQQNGETFNFKYNNGMVLYKADLLSFNDNSGEKKQSDIDKEKKDNDKNSIVNFKNEYSSLWNDFVNIRINLIENELKYLFLNILNVNKSDLDYFYSHFKYYRNQCVLLPTNTGYRAPFHNNFQRYKEIVNYFWNNNNNNNNNSNTNRNSTNNYNIVKFNDINPILIYFYIWNTIFTIMNKPYGKDQKKGYKPGNIDFRYGFDNKITKNDLENNSVTSNKILALLKDWLLNEFSQTNVFGQFHDGYENNETNGPTEKETIEEIEVKREENKKSFNKCLLSLFNNDLTSFEKLLEYVIKDLDLTNINNYKQYINYDKYEEKYVNGTGISNFIVNRLSYVIFHDLVISQSLTNNSGSYVTMSLIILFFVLLL